MFGIGSITEILARLIVLFSAITVHEYAHGYVAYKLGDPTAKYSGRLSLNPLSHIDPMGAICMIVLGFGWAKPVPVNPMYFKNRKRDSALVALAGPISNIILAFLTAIVFSLYIVFLAPLIWSTIASFISEIFVQLAFLNISFAVFNLIPFPPLDGSKILGAVLSQENYMRFLQYERFGFPILIILSLTGVLGKILSVFVMPVYNLWNALFTAIISILL